jgi:hypothetical protein
MATSIAYNLANLALSTSSTSNVNVAVFAGNVTTVQYINAGNIQTGNMSLGGSLVFSDGSSLSSVTSAISVFDYTGNGSQTVFATGNYSATSTLDTNVYISGVYQRKNTYTWSGTNITFTSGAPPLNSNIEIMVNTYATGIAVPNDGSVTPIKLSTGGPAWDANGNVGINTSTAAFKLVINGTDAMLVPVGTTAQRPGSPTAGVLRYNSSYSLFEGYNGSSWGQLGGAQGGGGDQIFWQNGNTVTANYTVPVGSNAGTFGPVAINNGITVTISSGSTWSIV